jgi:hypothetical protein
MERKRDNYLLLGGSLLLRGGLLLRGSSLFGGRSLLLGSSNLLELVASLDLGEFTLLNGTLEGVKEHSVDKLLVLGELFLNYLLDGDGGGTGAILEGFDGVEDGGFVRHVDGW